MVTRLAILRLQPGVVGWTFALVISDDGVQPPEEAHRRIQRHDRGEADDFGGFPLSRTVHARRQYVESAWSLRRQDSGHGRSRACVRKAAGIFGLEPKWG